MVANVGSELTFINAVRTEVTERINEIIQDWMVSKELSDHNHFMLGVQSATSNRQTYRVLKKTNWEGNLDVGDDL